MLHQMGTRWGLDGDQIGTIWALSCVHIGNHDIEMALFYEEVTTLTTKAIEDENKDENEDKYEDEDEE